MGLPAPPAHLQEVGNGSAIVQRQVQAEALPRAWQLRLQHRVDCLAPRLPMQIALSCPPAWVCSCCLQ